MEKEAAPKKQFRLKKKTLSIFLGLFVVLALVAAGVTYFLLKEREGRLEVESEYNRLLEYCGETGEDTVECKVLLGDFYDSEDGKKDCMEIVLPVADVETREVSLCLKKGVIEWENPYPDYSMYVPVSIDLDENLSLGEVEVLEISVLDDTEALELIGNIYNVEGGDPSFIWTREYKESLERGYDLIGTAGSFEEEFSPSGLSVSGGRVLSYDLDGKNIELKLEAYLLGQKREFSVEVEEFPVVNVASGEGFWVSPQNIGELDMEVEYDLVFFLRDPDLFSRDFIEEQLLLLIEGKESNLLFDGLDIIDEE